MVYHWDRDKPESINDKTWRRKQIEKYLDYHPYCKPKDVVDWLEAQTPNPWPSCDTNSLGKIMRRLRKSTSKKCLFLCPTVQYDEYMPLVIKWDMRMPEEQDIHKWRRLQLTRYLDEYPEHKPKQVLE